MMTLLKKMLAVTTAVALVGGPIAASAAPAAQKLSVARAGAPSQGAKSDMGGGSIIYIVAALAVIGGIILIADKKKPKSP
jgi:hypothetical protein